MNPLDTTLRFCCFISLLFFSFTTYSQTNILGRMVDESDNTPLPYASVYFNKTTIGTYTNEHGEFYFETVRMLNTELIICCPGYEITVYKPTVQQIEGKRMVFKLRYKEAFLVNKPTLSIDTRKSLLAIFFQNLLGITEEAGKSKIMNDSVIYFGGGETQNSFRAYANSPLMIINNVLGYKIIFNLEDFWYDNATRQHNFFGYARYEELGTDKKWLRNRRKCYYGSTLHFYRSLVAHQLYNEGFGTFLVKTDSIKINGLDIGGMVIRVHETTGLEPISDQDIMYIDSSNNFSINVVGQLLVQYNQNTSTKNYLVQNDIFMSGFLPDGVESYIQFKEPLTGINYAGVLDDYNSVSYLGYWIYERLANTLPVNYRPEN